MVTSLAALIKFASCSEALSWLRNSATEMLNANESLSMKSTVYIRPCETAYQLGRTKETRALSFKKHYCECNRNKKIELPKCKTKIQFTMNSIMKYRQAYYAHFPHCQTVSHSQSPVTALLCCVFWALPKELKLDQLSHAKPFTAFTATRSQ